MAKHGRSSQVSCWHSSHPCNPQLLWPCFTGCSATTAAVCGEQGPYSLCATLGMHQQSWRGALMPWSTDSTDSWLAESVWQDRRALLLIAALGWIQVKAVLDAPSNTCQCKWWYLKEGWSIIMYFAAVGHLICTKLVNWNLLRCTVAFVFEGKTERLCYVAMLQKQVPKFPKMSTPMNLAARRRAAICNLGKELKVNGFPWSGRLGADNQFVLFVQVYDNEGHKANAVQRQETPSTRSITSGSKPVEAIDHYESHMEPPPNLQTEATCQWFGYTWLVSDKFEAWTPLPPFSVLQGWTLSIVAGMSSRKSRLSGLQILIHFARLVFWKKISWFCRCDDGCHFVVEYVWWSSPYWSLVVFVE